MSTVVSCTSEVEGGIGCAVGLAAGAGATGGVDAASELSVIIVVASAAAALLSRGFALLSMLAWR